MPGTEPLRPPPDGRVAVIGAGIAGLAAARELADRGHAVTLLDKGRGPGGRCCSRRAEPFSFDHGAQYFTARDPRFQRELRSWSEAGVVAPWAGRIVTLGPEGASPAGESDARYVAVPRMSALARHLARDLDVRVGTRVTAVEHDGLGWSLQGEGATPLGQFQRLLVTAPPPQAADLIGAASALGERARTIPMRSCWAVLLGLAAPYDAPFDGAFCEHDVLAWVARDSSKPGRPAAEAWVLHATPEWSEAHLDHEPRRVIARLSTALEEITGAALPSVRHADAHLWRHARPDPGLDVGCLLDAERGLVLAGDACLAGRVEGAWLSGRAAADRLG